MQDFQDMRERLKDNGINATWLAQKLSEATGTKIYQPRLQLILKGDAKSVGAYLIREKVSNYLDSLEKLNIGYFTKEE